MDNWDLYNYIHGGKSGSNATVDGIIDRSIKSIKNDRVTNIGAYAFRDCSQLTSIDLPNVTAIGGYAFYDCSQLTSIDFPNVTVIGRNAFSSCTNLASIKLTNNQVVTLRGANVFERTPIASGTGFIYVPDELVESYKTATNWTVYADQIKGLSELEET